MEFHWVNGFEIAVTVEDGTQDDGKAPLGIQVKEVNGTYDGLFNLVENLASQEGGE